MQTPPSTGTPRRFGTVDPFVEEGEWSYRMGRTIANRGFLRALLRHGSFDEYHLFCVDAHHRRELEREVRGWLGGGAGEGGGAGRVRFPLQAELAASLRATDYEVFHLSDFTFSLPHLAWLRNAVAAAPFPITGVTHSLDGVRMASRHVELALAGLAAHDAIVCTSRAGRDAVAHAAGWVRARLGDAVAGAMPRLAVIPLGAGDEAFELPDRAAARARFGIPPHRRVLLSVGRLSARSKCDWSPFLELLGRMRAAGELDGALVILAGGGSAADAALLEQMIKRQNLADTALVFANFPPDVKGALFAAADVYLGLVDNIQETFGLSIVEAMAAGLPIVAVDYSGYRDIVEDGASGLLVPTVASPTLPAALTDDIGVLDSSVTRFVFAQGLAVDLDVLRARLRELLGDEERRRALGAAARRRAETFRWAAVVKRYEALWTELAAEARRAPRGGGGAGAAREAVLWGDMPGTFAGFATRTLAPGDRVRLTEVGRALAAAGGATAGDPVTRLEDLQPFYVDALERAIVAALAEGPQTLAALGERAAAAAAGEDAGAPGGAAAVPFQVTFLLKHGIVALEKGDES